MDVFGQFRPCPYEGDQVVRKRFRCALIVFRDAAGAVREVFFSVRATIGTLRGISVTVLITVVCVRIWTGTVRGGIRENGGGGGNRTRVPGACFHGFYARSRSSVIRRRGSERQGTRWLTFFGRFCRLPRRPEGGGLTRVSLFIFHHGSAYRQV